MQDTFFIMIYLTFPLTVLLYMQRSRMSILKITIPNTLILSMFVYAYAGLMPLYFGWDEYRYNMGIQDRVLVFQILLLSMWSIIGLLFGFEYTKNTLKMRTIKELDFIRPLKQTELLCIFCLIALCFIVLVVYLSKVSQIALVVALTEGSGTSVTLARSNMGNNFAGKFHWYRLFFSDLFALTTWTLFSACLIERKKTTLFVLLVTFTGASFAAVMATEKSPFAHLLIGLLITYALTRQKGKIPLKQGVVFFALLCSTLVVFYIYFMGSSSVFSAFSSIFSRALSGSIQPAYYYLQYFPVEHDFLMGKSFPNPGGVMPYTPFPLTKEIMAWVDPNIDGIVGSMPTVFWAEAFANFGYFGVLIVPFFIGIIVYIIHYYSSKLENTPLKIGFYVWLMLHLKKLSTTGFSEFLYDVFIACISIILLITIALSNKLKIKYYKSTI